MTTVMKTLTTEYSTLQPGLRGGVTDRTVEVPVLSREEFDQLAAANPTGPVYQVGTAAGYPDSGYWIVKSVRHVGYDALVEHVGHGCRKPVAYCLSLR